MREAEVEGSTRGRWCRIVPLLLFLGIGVLLFPSTGRDDTHITLGAARGLARDGVIANVNGDRVEVSSALLHVLSLGALAWSSGSDPRHLALPFSVLCGLLSLVLVRRVASRSGASPWGASLLLATSAPFVYWSFSGMETSLVAALVLGVVLATGSLLEAPRRSRFLMAAVPTALLVVARPEGAMVLTLFLALAILDRRRRGRPAGALLGLLLVTVLVAAVLTGWRLWYFGDFLPQPVRAKVGSVVTARPGQGWSNLVRAVTLCPPLGVLILATLAAPFVQWRKDPAPTLAAGLWMSLAGLAFVLTSGGDWMEGARFLVPVLGPMLVVVLAAPGRGELLERRLGAVALAVQLPCLGLAAWMGSTAVPLPLVTRTTGAVPGAARYAFLERANQVHLRDMATIDELRGVLARIVASGLRPRILSAQAGMVAYHVLDEFRGRMDFTDLYSLSTRELASCPVLADVERGDHGHVVGYPRLLEDREALRARCGIELPDVIFDLDWIPRVGESRSGFLARSGYRIVFYQTGEALDLEAPVTRWFWLPDELFIAVREDLADDLGLSRRELELVPIRPW